MSYTPELVKNLLNTLFVHDYEDLVVDFDVVLRQNDEGKSGIGVDVIMDKKWYDKYEVDYDIEGLIEKQVKDILKYLSPSFVIVEFYVMV